MDNKVEENGEEKVKFKDYRLHVVFSACSWWIVLAICSRNEISFLQIPWTQYTSIVIFLYFPFCILLGAFGLINKNDKSWAVYVKFTPLYVVFWVFVALFFVQCILYMPPLASADPNTARLDWGFKYVHVATEIVLRTTVLIALGQAMLTLKFRKETYIIVLLTILYTVLVVSRSFMLEVVFYWSMASFIVKANKGINFGVVVKIAFAFIVIVSLFVAFGEWRQGEDFNAAEYGEMISDSNALAWVFGYFFVNFDNLALIIQEKYTNQSSSNVFGSILQTLQIVKYEEVDDYLYVGKFNLGTALRPFVLDFGVVFGGVVFSVIWIIYVLVQNVCKYASNRYSILLLIAYTAFCFPITSRMEQPPYLFPMLLIIIIDFIQQYRWILKFPFRGTTNI